MPSSSASSQYTVLRIKRKANEPAPASLVIGDDADQARRKRRDLGAARSRGVFRLADTVPPTWQGHGEEGEVLKSRIEGLLAGGGRGEPSPVAGPSAAAATPLPVPIPAPAAPPAPAPAPAATQYRVMPRTAGPRAQDPGLPPRVITLAEIEAARSALVLVDAQAVADAAGAAGLSRSALDDPQMAAFLPMLNEYLKLESTPRVVEEEEYVYDLYYRDIAGDDEPSASVATLLGYEDLSPPSTPPDSEPEDEADEDSNDEDYYRNDYPEDEDADEDMEGFEDAYSDGEWSNDGDDDEDERGTWDYR
ncbi:hypothetical protein Q8F55_006898 [Vanrija albida]|uniref:Probable RNA polymerase II nuclear localization protein SLC7A6OS n=1 Tax=Vanrija albida TaxID=181172 RepID=A0ABR3PYI9_9TREE